MSSPPVSVAAMARLLITIISIRTASSLASCDECSPGLKMTGTIVRFSCSGKNLKTIPHECFPRNITALHLSDNAIEELVGQPFQRYPDLKEINLNHNQISKWEETVFQNLSELAHLSLANNLISNIKKEHFIGLTSLTILILASNDIKEVDDFTFPEMRRLTNLDLSNNAIEELVGQPFQRYPDLGEIKLSYNQISKWEETVFQNLSELAHLDLEDNLISNIKKEHFIGLTSLTILTLASNDIEEVEDFTFVEMCQLSSLKLHKNRNLKTIHPRAFAGLWRLYDVDLSDTNIESFPYDDIFRSIRRISVKNVRKLTQFPTHEDLSSIRNLRLTYPAHCCKFIDGHWHPESATPTIHPSTTPHGVAHVFTGGNPFDRKTRDTGDELVLLQRSGKARRECRRPGPTRPADVKNNITCTPEPDLFNSCDNVMGWWPLRIFVWIIILVNVIGNFTVIATIIVAYERFTAVRLLLINMAFADLWMGVYLITIGIVDASTYGTYANHAPSWKTGGGCQFAGFVSVFSSELSLYMLTSITIERLYRLQNALYFKKMHMKQAIAIVTIGWVFAIVMAMLPLVGVNDYTVSAICLPFDVSDAGGKAYVTILLMLNLIAFFIILTVYSYLFCSITGGKFHKQNRDVSVFKKMSLLVAVDFFCWFPIIILGLLATYRGLSISLGAAKVIMVFIYPLNACANPFLYVIFTIQFRRDFFEFWYRKFGLFEKQYRNTLENLTPASPRRHNNRRGTELTGLPMNGSQRPSQTSDTMSMARPSSPRNGIVQTGDDGRKVSANSNTEVTTVSNGMVGGENSVAMEATNQLGILAEEGQEEDLDVSWLSESATV